MKDFFKEINIIDILGIGVPGCLLVLLLGGDKTAELLWMKQFQEQPLAFSVVLITTGSLVGMLIQELGDLIEKGLWMFPRLDPKFYAAHVVKLNDSDIARLKTVKYTTYQETENQLGKWLCAGAAAAAVFCASALLPLALKKAAEVTRADVSVGNGVWFGSWPLLLSVIVAWSFFSKLPKKESPEWKKLIEIREANPYIQTVLVGHGNASKRTLFDGWRFVMRNLVLVLAVANLVSIWKPLDLYRRVAGILISESGDMTRDLYKLLLFASSAIALMLVRYYHYAYLRYKYSLEDFIQLTREEIDEDSQPDDDRNKEDNRNKKKEVTS